LIRRGVRMCVDIFLSKNRVCCGRRWARSSKREPRGYRGPKVGEGPEPVLPDLDVTLATADLEMKKEKAPVWGLRGFLPGLEVLKGVSAAALLRVGVRRDLSGDGPPINGAYRILTKTGGTEML
jgi:hypothetical protein